MEDENKYKKKKKNIQKMEIEKLKELAKEKFLKIRNRYFNYTIPPRKELWIRDESSITEDEIPFVEEDDYYNQDIPEDYFDITEDYFDIISSNSEEDDDMDYILSPSSSPTTKKKYSYPKKNIHKKKKQLFLWKIIQKSPLIDPETNKPRNIIYLKRISNNNIYNHSNNNNTNNVNI